jgi:hypothetical protein
MIGPSYIVYPYDRPNLDDGIIITGARGNDNNNLPSSDSINSYSISELKKDATYGRQVGFIYKNPQNTNNVRNKFKHVFTVRSNTSNTNTTHNRNISLSPGEIPKGNSCASYLSSEELKIDTGKIYLNLVKISGREESSFVLVINLNPSGEYINDNGDHKNICKETIKIQPFHKEDKFYENINAYKQVEKIHITLNENIYSIRVPTINDGKNLVQDNWNELIFTDEEAKFLNSVRFTPGILAAVFEATWKTELSNFLINLVYNKCVSDVNLLTKADCYNSRKFLNRVNEYFIDNYLAADLIEDNNEIHQDRQESNNFKKESKIIQGPPIDSEDATVIPDDRKDEIREIELGNFKKSKYYHNERNQQGQEYTAFVRAAIIGINKDDGSHKYYTISVPYEVPRKDGKVIQSPSEEERKEFDAKEVKALKDKFKSLKKKYPNYIFVF